MVKSWEAWGEANDKKRWADVKVVSYLNQSPFLQHAQKVVEVRTTREMQTWAECIDLLLEGNLVRLGDTMTQRLQALM